MIRRDYVKTAQESVANREKGRFSGENAFVILEVVMDGGKRSGLETRRDMRIQAAKKGFRLDAPADP